MALQERIGKYLDACPPAIAHQRGDNQTFVVDCALVHGFALNEGDAMAWLRIYNQKCEPPWSEAELLHKVRSALGAAHKRRRGYLLDDCDEIHGPCSSPLRKEELSGPLSAPKPVYDPAYLKDFTAQLCDEIDALYLESRSEFNCHNRSPAGFLHKVFRAGERVWITDKLESREGLIWTHDGEGQNLAELNHLQNGRPGVWFLSNPIDGSPHQLKRLQTRRNAEGISLRCTECITSWRHVVLETDDAPSPLWLKALCLLKLPVVAIYHSGKRGPHALVNLGATTQAQWHERLAPHREHLIRLGACTGTLTPVRPSRLPNCVREQTGQLQQLLFLAPNADSTPIAKRPVREPPLAVWERYLEAARYGRSDNEPTPL
jgi:hypothetical protein